MCLAYEWEKWNLEFTANRHFVFKTKWHLELLPGWSGDYFRSWNFTSPVCDSKMYNGEKDVESPRKENCAGQPSFHWHGQPLTFQDADQMPPLPGCCPLPWFVWSAFRAPVPAASCDSLNSSPQHRASFSLTTCLGPLRQGPLIIHLWFCSNYSMAWYFIVIPDLNWVVTN